MAYLGTSVTAGCLLVGTLSFSSITAAAEAGANLIEELVVTARRREETAQSVPIPVTALSGDDLESRGAQDLRDLTRLTPNLSFKNSGVAKNTAQVYLRGIGQINWGPAQDPKVGVYLDGVYLARPQGGVFDLMDVERVEVLRGPQGTLFGRNTTAGLIHVVTKRPGDQFELKLRGQGGQDGQLGAGVSLNVPLADTLAARMSVQHRESDGFVKNRFDGRMWNDENAQNARASFLWTPSDAFDALLNVDYQRVRELSTVATCVFIGPESGATAPGLEGLAFFGGFYDSIRDTCRADSEYRGYEDDPNPDSRIDAWGTGLTLTWNISPSLQLTSITGYRDIEEVNGSWGLGGDSPLGDLVEVQQRNNSPSEFTQLSEELRLNGSGMNERLNWVAGVYVFTEDAQGNVDVPLFRKWQPPDCVANPFQLACFPLVPGFPAFGTLGDLLIGLQTNNSVFQVYDAKNESQAIFAEVTYDATEALSITAGVRYTKDERRLSLLQELLTGAADTGYVCPDGSAPVARICTRKGDFKQTTPRVILSYQLNDDVMVYGSWSKGYSSGGFNQNPRLQDYLPEVSKNWELGFKSILFDKRLKLNMTTYYNTYENQQLSVARIIDNQNVIAILNAQEATLYGVEAELLAVLGNWTLTVAVGTTDGKYEEFEVEDTTIGPAPLLLETTELRDLSDNELVLGSPYTYSLGVAHHLDMGSSGSLDSQLGWAYRGRQYNDLDAFEAIKQKPYGLLDARITWRLANGRTSIALAGSNLLDKEYFPTAIGNGTGARLGYYWGQPRRVRLELTHDIGG